MRLLLMYDLPMSTPQAQKEYTKFHKWIINKGFIMIQQSIYIRVINAPSKANYEIKALNKHMPTDGNIRILIITENQYYNMRILRGKKSLNEISYSQDRFLKINNED